MHLALWLSLTLSVPPGSARCGDALRSLLSPRASVEGCQSKRFDEVQLPTGDQPEQVTRLEGRVAHLRWTEPPELGPEQLLARQEQALHAQGFRRVYQRAEGSVHQVILQREGPPESWASLTVESLNLGALLALEGTWVETTPLSPRFEKARPDRRDAKGCVDPLGLGRIRGAFIDECEAPRHGELELSIDLHRKEVHPGRLASARYRHRPDDSSLEVFHSYRLALEGAGFSIVHQQLDGSERQLTAARDLQGQTQWVALAVGPVNGDQWVQTYLSVLTRAAPSLK